MREIVIPGIGIKIPVIGFGCSSLTGVNRKTAVGLLETAFEAGVRHFDVARSYGYGEAEKILGAFVKSRRAEITITTKFGIRPPQQTIARRVAVGVGRRFLRLVPAARPLIQPQTRAAVTTGAFSVKDAEHSLETSLRELGTDYVDFFLLHEYKFSERAAEDLQQFLGDAVTRGKIRYFGIGTDIDDVLNGLQFQPEFCGVIQFENSVLAQNIRRLPKGSANRLVVTHGALAASYRSILAFLKSDREATKRWSANLGVDCSRPESIAALTLKYAVEANPHGIVLFSSKSAKRVADNIRAALEPGIVPEQSAMFAQLVGQESKRLTQ
jgi:D-threo-aldose 1-dehydrogenase